MGVFLAVFIFVFCVAASKPPEGGKNVVFKGIITVPDDLKAGELFYPLETITTNSTGWEGRIGVIALVWFFDPPVCNVRSYRNTYECGITYVEASQIERGIVIPEPTSNQKIGFYFLWHLDPGWSAKLVKNVMTVKVE